MCKRPAVLTTCCHASQFVCRDSSGARAQLTQRVHTDADRGRPLGRPTGCADRGARAGGWNEAHNPHPTATCTTPCTPVLAAQPQDVFSSTAHVRPLQHPRVVPSLFACGGVTGPNTASASKEAPSIRRKEFKLLHYHSAAQFPPPSLPHTTPTLIPACVQTESPTP